MKGNRKSALLLIGLLLIGSTNLQAERLIIPIGSQAKNALSTLPAQGEKKGYVLKHFGEPEAVVAPTGTPPISRWDYSGYTVYFENDHVIHSVIKFQRSGQ